MPAAAPTPWPPCCCRACKRRYAHAPVAGDRDRTYTPELFQETAHRIPRAWLWLCPGKGHASIATLSYKPAVCELFRFLTADRPEPSTRSLRPRR